MPSEKLAKAPADHVVLVLSPALVMGMVGSLVFFLLEILYRGDYQDRLQWILFFFVFGAVLIARIGLMAEIAARSGLYGGILGLLVWLAMQQLVEYPEGMKAWSWLINLALIGVVWWSSQRLTESCTHFDPQAEMPGEGLMQAAGLEGTQAPPAPPPKQSRREGWMARYQRYTEERRSRRPLGMWVVYFSLAALPIYGLGQALIPIEETGRRAYAFWLMSIYVGSGLGLLLTTCFLSLRVYLRQRKLQMPLAMTSMWLSVGGTIVAVLMVAGALLPRPQAEYSVVALLQGKSPRRSASKWAVKRGSPAQEKGRGTVGKSEEPLPPEEGKDGQQGGEQGREGEGRRGDRSESRSGNEEGDRSSPQGQDRDQKGKSAASSSGQEDQDQKGQQEQRPEQQSQTTRRQESSSQQQQQRGGPKKTPAAPPLGGFLGSLARFLKVIVFILVGLVALFFVGRSVLQHLAHFTDWAQQLLNALQAFWERLFGSPERPPAEPAESRQAEEREQQQPFSEFINPFRLGQAMPAGRMVRYTFAAVQAWARERGLGRQPEETPLEFVGRVSAEVPALEEALDRLVVLYAQAAYGQGGLPAGTAGVLRAVWERLEAVARQPLSA